MRRVMFWRFNMRLIWTCLILLVGFSPLSPVFAKVSSCLELRIDGAGSAFRDELAWAWRNTESNTSYEYVAGKKWKIVGYDFLGFCHISFDEPVGPVYASEFEFRVDQPDVNVKYEDHREKKGTSLPQGLFSLTERDGELAIKTSQDWPPILCKRFPRNLIRSDKFPALTENEALICADPGYDTAFWLFTRTW